MVDTEQPEVERELSKGAQARVDAQNAHIQKTKNAIQEGLKQKLCVDRPGKPKLRTARVIECFAELVLAGMIRDSQINELRQQMEIDSGVAAAEDEKSREKVGV